MFIPSYNNTRLINKGQQLYDYFVFHLGFSENQYDEDHI